MRAIELVVAGLAIGATAGLASCGFRPHCTQDTTCFGGKPDTATSAQHKVIFSVPGVLIAYQGTSCAEAHKSGVQGLLVLDENLDISGFKSATVFLNGWHLTYTNGDHHVAGIGTAISDIATNRTPDTLSWRAMGTISDDNFDDPYKWCYFYTAVAWNPAVIDLTIDQDGVCGDHGNAPVNFFSGTNGATLSALTPYERFLKSDAFATSPTVAILPRGFGFLWGTDNGIFDNFACQDVDDHHLLELSYHLGPSEIFVARGKSYRNNVTTVTPLPPPPEDKGGQVDSGFVSWVSEAIFKDNDDRRDYVFGEVVSGMGGRDLGQLQPPFYVSPHEAENLVISPDVVGPAVIDDVPFELALPMLTGWDLRYPTDHHVRDIGVWIDAINYQKAANAPTGKLSYNLSSVLKDDSGNVGIVRHNVSVLGFKGVAAAVKAAGAVKGAGAK